MNVAKLLFGDLGGSVHHEVLRVLVHREGDDLADVGLVEQEHDHTVNAGGNACVGRCAELEGVIEGGKLRFNDVSAHADDLKCLEHQLGVMVTDGTRGKLNAVADDVVLVGENVEGILREKCLHTALRH